MTGKTFLPMNEYIAYSSDLADKIMQKIYGKDYDNFIIYSKTYPDISFTEKGQDIYNEIIDKVEEFLADVGIYPESEEEKKNVIPK